MMKLRISILASSSIMIGALAALLAILPFSFSYPIIPYLKFDVAEIPVVLGFLLFGPGTGILSSAIYGFILAVITAGDPLSFWPVGAVMKFTSVFSMLIGLWMGFRMQPSQRGGLIFGSALGCIIRVAVMSVFNYLVLLFVLPRAFEIAAASISTFLSISFSTASTAFIMTMIFTAIFNILHTILSIIPAYIIVRSLTGINGRIGVEEFWYIRLARAASRRSPQRS
jgi:riboflavin transporter FmnP